MKQPVLSNGRVSALVFLGKQIPLRERSENNYVGEKNYTEKEKQLE